MNPDQFTPFAAQEPPEGEWVIVTNNITATDNRNRMTHLWLTKFITKDDSGFLTYDEAERRVWGLTHWKKA